MGKRHPKEPFVAPECNVIYVVPYWGNVDYRVGDDGTFWSRRRGGIWKKRKPSPLSKKNPRPGLSFIFDGKIKFLLVQNIVLKSFRGPRPDGKECCHNDGDIMNNRLDNLRWDTRKNNFKDRDKHGKTVRGEKMNTAKLTEDIVLRIRREYTPGKGTKNPAKKLADLYGVDVSLIHMIVKRRIWRHV